MAPLLSDQPVFFPDYTDHGPQHVRETLATALELIPDDAAEVFSSQDAAVLVLAVLLHDLGMHLTPESFLRLLRQSEKTPGLYKVPLLDVRSIHEDWFAFLEQAQRFDETQLLAVFGDTEPATLPATDPLGWTRRDFLLIGEFLRRYHPKLAHLIALNGFPTAHGRAHIELPRALPPALKDIAGMVARSHGQSVRSLLDYLQMKYPPITDFDGVHSVYLMVLLRIADYLQLQATRAPQERFRVRALKSPISRREWRVHREIRNISVNNPDPECLFVDALPETVEDWHRLTQLLQGLQRELDMSWAVLGEVYGRYERLRDLGLTIRRVRSSLDQTRELETKLNFVPREARFRSAGVRLLKLLIRPLYGDDPKYGVRELLQNALDAVRERVEVEPAHSDKASVRISIEPQHCKLIVQDNGLGMVLDTVIDCFLTAGASFRYTEAWRRDYAGADGESKVLRSGRFGIGALAAFLIGDELEVVTRHRSMAKSEGLHFSASLHSDLIEIQRVAAPVGTTISIRMTPSTREKVEKALRKSDSMYLLDWPPVEVSLDGHVHLISQSWPRAGCARDPWKTLAPTGFQEVMWSYRGRYSEKLVCNGLLVGSVYPRELIVKDPGLRVPTLSVFDPNGRLPLNLSRNGLSAAVPFLGELAQSIAKDVVDSMERNRSRPWGRAGRPKVKIPHRGVDPETGRGDALSQRNTFVFVRDGFSMLDADFWTNAEINRLTIIGGSFPCRRPRGEKHAVIWAMDGRWSRLVSNKSVLWELVRAALISRRASLGAPLQLKTVRLVLPSATLSRLHDSKAPKSVQRLRVKELECGIELCSYVGSKRELGPSPALLKGASSEESWFVLDALVKKAPLSEIGSCILTEIARRHGSVWIPYADGGR